jgi:hypothetical protein
VPIRPENGLKLSPLAGVIDTYDVFGQFAVPRGQRHQSFRLGSLDNVTSVESRWGAKCRHGGRGVPLENAELESEGECSGAARGRRPVMSALHLVQAPIPPTRRHVGPLLRPR